MATDYSAVKADVEYFSARTDLTSAIHDRLFRITCEKLARVLRPIETETTLSLTGADFPYTDSSNAILEILSVYCTRSSTTRRLDYVPLEKLRNIQSTSSGATPQYYSTVGQQIVIGPAPASTDAIAVVYSARQDDTLADSETNSYITWYGSIVMWQMLAELYKSLHDTEKFTAWEAMADNAIDAANNLAWNRRAGGRLSIRNS